MIKETIVPMELIKELGRRIQKARKEKGLTQQEDVYKRQAVIIFASDRSTIVS